MPNEGGNNNECKYYGVEERNASVIDDTRMELDKLNSTTDMMKATHYAVITRSS